MLYLLYGTKTFLMGEELKKITKDFDEINISKYDLTNDNIKDIIDDALTISLFSDKKLIICENANVFTGVTSKDAEIIEKYLNNPNSLTTLVFTLNTDKIDNRKKITKLMKKNGIIKDFSENIDPVSFVKRKLKDYEINTMTINLLIDRVGSDLLILENEINKIKLYKDNDKKIDENDIINLTTKTSYEDIFKLIDYIIEDNKEKSLEILIEMIKNGEEPIKIIIILANQIRIMYQSKVLLKKGLSEKSIADSLSIHPYRVKLALQKGRRYTEDILLNYLSELADIDYGIKSGKINKDLALEMFILKK